MSHKQRVGIFGASSMVGHHVIKQLQKSGFQVVAFSREQHKIDRLAIQYPDVLWCLLDDSISQGNHTEAISQWIYLAPIWTLFEHLSLLTAYQAERLIAVSSTSRFTKLSSSDKSELAIVKKLIDAEQRLQSWSSQANIAWIVLQPTLIYDPGKDQNITTIMRFIMRFRFFPLLGQAQGLRQPIHARDVAQASCQVLAAANLQNKSYTISGAETLTYREMVEQVFLQLGKPIHIVSLPMSLFYLAIRVLKFVPHFRKLSPEMALRMNQDMDFDNRRAITDFGFIPKPFRIKK